MWQVLYIEHFSLAMFAYDLTIWAFSALLFVSFPAHLVIDGESLRAPMRMEGAPHHGADAIEQKNTRLVLLYFQWLRLL